MEELSKQELEKLKKEISQLAKKALEKNQQVDRFFGELKANPRFIKSLKKKRNK